MVLVTDKQFYMSNLLKQNLDFAKQAVEKDDDFVILIDGRERAGKSVLAQQIAYYLDPNFNVDNICFRVDDWQERVRNAEKYSCIVWDEAFRGLSKRQALSTINRKVVQTMMEMGQNNLYIILVLPTFFEIDKYVALHRCKCLVHVHRDRNYRRGFYKFYNFNKMKTMYILGKKEYKYCQKCDFPDTFTNAYTVDEDAYREKKIVELQKDEDQIFESVPRAIQQRNILLDYFNKKFYNNLSKMNRDVISEYPEFDLAIRQMQMITKKMNDFRAL